MLWDSVYTTMLNLRAPVTFLADLLILQATLLSLLILMSFLWALCCKKRCIGVRKLRTRYDKASAKSWLLYSVPQKGLSYSQKNGQTWIWPKIWPTRVTNFTFYSENVRNISSWFTQPSISSIFQSTPLSTGLTTRVAEFARKISTVSRDSLPPSYSRCDLRRLVQIK